MLRSAIRIALFAIALAPPAPRLYAQGAGNGNNGGNGGNVGGIVIDPDGILQPMRVAPMLRPRRQPTGDLARQGDVCVSLRRLGELLAEATPASVAPDACVLGGLTAIDQIVVDVERRDLLLIGPGERQTPGSPPTFVGEVSGRPLMRTGDFLMMLDRARTLRFRIRCSIDPEPARLREYNETIRRTAASVSFNNAAAWYEGLARILGRQIVTIDGVPADSRIGNVLAAADYSMKRIALGLEPSGVKEIRGQLAYAAGDTGSQMKRWWFAQQYDDVRVSPDRTVFQLSGPRVRLLAQEELILDDGRRINSDRNRPSTEAFARQFSAHFEELTAVRPIFADLRNQFDLAVVAALLVRERVLDRIDLRLEPPPDVVASLNPKCFTPKFVDSAANLRRVNRSTMIGVVGGVELSPTDVLRGEARLDPEGSAWKYDPPAGFEKSQFSWQLALP